LAMAGNSGQGRAWLGFTLAAMSVAAVMMAGTMLYGVKTTELEVNSLPVTYLKGVSTEVHQLDRDDYQSGKHPSLHDAAFLAQLSNVLDTHHGKHGDKQGGRMQSLDDLDLGLKDDVESAPEEGEAKAVDSDEAEDLDLGLKDAVEAESAVPEEGEGEAAGSEEEATEGEKEEEPAAEEEEPTQHPLGDEVFELPIHNGEDMGDLHVPAEYLQGAGYAFAGFKSGSHKTVLTSAKRSAGQSWCHCDAAGKECGCSPGGNTGLEGGRAVKRMSLMMNCCQCDGSQVELPAGPCSDCYECGSKAFSPNYNPYGVRKQKAMGATTPILRQQQQRAWAAEEGKAEGFWKKGEHKALPTDGMQTLNTIIAGARDFVRPPPTKDVYKVVKKTVIKKDPLVAAS